MFFPTPPHYIGPTTNPPFYFPSYTSPIAPVAMKIGPKNSKTAQLSPVQRSAIISAHENGATQVQLANDFCCSRRTIYNTLKRYSEAEKLENREKSGRPPILSERACHHLYVQARRHPFWTYKQLSAATASNPSPSTIRRILRRFGLGKRRSRQKIPIRPSLARKRLKFARKWRRNRNKIHAKGEKDS
jgi:transposase